MKLGQQTELNKCVVKVACLGWLNPACDGACLDQQQRRNTMKPAAGVRAASLFYCSHCRAGAHTCVGAHLGSAASPPQGDLISSPLAPALQCCRSGCLSARNARWSRNKSGEMFQQLGHSPGIWMALCCSSFLCGHCLMQMHKASCALDQSLCWRQLGARASRQLCQAK